MKIASKKRMLAFPVGCVFSIATALGSEITGIGLLVPIAFVILIVSVGIAAPGVATAVGAFYSLLAKRDVKYSLISGALKYRSHTIGASSMMLFILSSMIALVTGLTNAGVSEVSDGQSYWRPEYKWGLISPDKRDDVQTLIDRNREEVGKPNVVRFGQGRMRPQDRGAELPRNVFIMDCLDYKVASVDDFNCPAFGSPPAVLVPEGLDRALVSNEVFFPASGSNESTMIADAEVIMVPGLTEILVAPELVPAIPATEYVLLPPTAGPETMLDFAEVTTNGFSSQEAIDHRSATMKSGYNAIANYLSFILLIFGAAIVIAQSASAIHDRRTLIQGMTLRGVSLAEVRALLTLETVHLSVPYIVAGFACGLVVAMAIATVSSMDAINVLNINLIPGLVILALGAALVPRANIALLQRQESDSYV